LAAVAEGGTMSQKIEAPCCAVPCLLSLSSSRSRPIARLCQILGQRDVGIKG